MQKLYWESFHINGSKSFFTVTDKGINFISSPGKGLSQINEFYPNHEFEFIYDSTYTSQYYKEIKEYIKGKRKYFDLAIDYLGIGTDLQLKVWKRIQEIPYGEKITYSKLADEVHSNATRAVASAVAKNPILIIVPCHRVVRKDNKSLKYRGGLELIEYLNYLEANPKKKQKK
ncbi:methylated-DNA--[protein]-cysteine S-methyltransferase [Lactobacillus sp. S2-2]|uniref:methylated-DNA--[protein]-cysteine S-methyltransferase n=1 Tax=Lactobacillus sp. S2-2 TaxID=2692917 RepID=UPI001F2588F4|nr:methylated-DNA--[protein]-cysteine S-methyltransferase [Lactobacillus sp. S2-2]MCF6514628.1 methylated-DNA--[protein]-cysteine S-methyltransferase [Lactobacillus sp. S2-2]